MKSIFPLVIFITLFSCSEKTTEKKLETKKDTTVEIKDTVKKQTTVTSNPGIALLQKLTKKLKPLAIPSIIESDRKIDSSWIKLSNEEIKLFIPEETLENKQPQIFAINKFNSDSGTGILYSIIFPEFKPEDMDPDDVLNKTLLVLYTNDGQYQDHQLLAIDDYGKGRSKFNTLNEFVYVYSSEMEFINISKTVYSIEDLKFKEISSEDKTFTSSNDGAEKMEAYLKKVL